MPALAGSSDTAVFNRYQRAGVREYWIVDPDTRIVLVHTLEEGQYHAADAYTVGVGAKAAINALKAVPGIHLGASLINAVTAGSIAAALGEGAAHIFEQIYLGNKTTADIDWVTKMMESKFAGSFVKRLNTAVSELPANAGKEEIARVILKLLRAK